MRIDRAKALKAFDDYVKKYDIKDEKIRLKIEHTYRVCELCEKIALSLKLNKSEIDIAWLTGLLHDIGRFEQVKTYGTFNDAISVNHAKLGADILFNKGSEILFKDGNIRDFIYDKSEDDLIKIVIESHNKHRIPENISERYKTFCNILRDADKVDIFKVNVIVPTEEIYNVTKEEIYTTKVTEEVLENFKRRDTILRSLKKTAVDNVVGHISLLFGLVYDESIKLVEEQGYLKKILEFKSENERTNKQFDEMREVVREYIEEIEY